MKKMLRLTQHLIMTALLVSCGSRGSGSKEEQFKPALDTNTECKIVVKGDYSNFDALDIEFDRFNEYYPNVELDYQPIDGDIATVLKGDEAPNIFFSQPKYIDETSYATVVDYMEDLTNPDLKLNLDSIRPNLLKRNSEGKVLMVPVFSRTYGMIVNKTLFNDEELKIPTTWDELTSVCDTLLERGYESPMMGYTNYDPDKSKVRNKVSNGFQNTIAYPLFIAELAKNPDALELANKLDPSAGEYMRGALEKVKYFFDQGYIDIDKCDSEIEDSYNLVLLRFLQGDVPMMVCNGDTVSGIKKREEKSTAFIDNPFEYAFYPIPTTAEGGYFIDSPSVQFSVNKRCQNLDMTNEFMRFLLRTEELNNLASWKGLICSTKTNPFPPISYFDKTAGKTVYTAVYDPFNNVPAGRTISPEVIGVKDTLVNQIKCAAFYVGRGVKTIQDMIDAYGTIK